MTKSSDSKKTRPTWQWIVTGFLVLGGIGLLISIGLGYQNIMAEPETAEVPEAVEDQDQQEPPLFQINFFGSGDRTFELGLRGIRAKSVGIASIKHTGSGNFSIWALNENQEQQELLVSKIGNYAGTVLFNPSRGKIISAFEIVADGSWTVTIKDIRSLEEIRRSSVATGEGDGVLLYNGEATVATVSHEGENNFTLWTHADSTYQLIVDGIGSYSLLDVPLRAGPVMIQVSSEGVWSLELE